MPRLLIAASGTGGHIFPALSVAESLPDSWDITWLGVPDRLEVELVPHIYRKKTIPVSALQGGKIQKILKMVRLLLSSICVARFIKRNAIQVVFTTGGYIAAPAIIAAKLSGVSVLLHESNAVPGKVTRLLGRFCNHVALGLPTAAENLLNCRIVVTGTPVRKSFLVRHSLPDWVPTGAGPLIVVMGGSQGAIGLNRMTRQVLPWLLKMGCRIVHITGEKDEGSNLLNENFVQKTFTEEIPALFQHASLVISRAGAGALSELSVCNVPAIFVPFPYATDNHQEQNAQYAAQYGAAIVVHENLEDKESLKDIIEPLLSGFEFHANQSNGLLYEMSLAMKKIAMENSHLQLVEILKSYC